MVINKKLKEIAYRQTVINVENIEADLGHCNNFHKSFLLRLEVTYFFRHVISTLDQRTVVLELPHLAINCLVS